MKLSPVTNIVGIRPQTADTSFSQPHPKRLDEQFLNDLRCVASAPGIRNHPSSLEARSMERIRAIVAGKQTRRVLSVASIAPNIIRTSFRPRNDLPSHFSVPASSPLSELHSLVKEGAAYWRLTVVGGECRAGVVGTGNGDMPVAPSKLADKAPLTSAVVNGGYFVHKTNLQSNGGHELTDVGVPIGPTSSRDDHAPIPHPWEKDYGHVVIGRKHIGLTSGPVLAINGKPQPLPDDNRFKYRVNGTENPLNVFAGALTHASDHNERAAISVTLGSQGRPGNVVMHALVTEGNRNVGASLETWRQITQVGARSVQGQCLDKTQGNESTLNLDGGGSVFLGVRDANGVTMLARGGPSNEPLRPVANVIFSQPSGANDRG